VVVSNTYFEGMKNPNQAINSNIYKFKGGEIASGYLFKKV
jgi:hypothetical protein